MSTTHTRYLVSHGDSIWVSTRVKGSRHKHFLAKPIYWLSLLVKDLSGRSGYSFIILILLAGEVKRNSGPTNKQTKCPVCPICEDTMIQEARGRSMHKHLRDAKTPSHMHVHKCTELFSNLSLCVFYHPWFVER